MAPFFSAARFSSRRWPAPRLGLIHLALTLLIFAAHSADAAPYTLANTAVHALPRSANGRDYTLYVGLPSSYATSPARNYPVIYACDGYWDFSLLLAETGNLTVDGAMPECIVVGFSYTGDSPNYGALRQWDLTPGYDAYAGTNSGHAAEFLGVIADEFIPFIERQYRVDRSFRVLTGSSYGGLFTVYALLEKMSLFQAYVAVSPSLWWRNRELLTRERTYAAAHTALPVRLFLSYAGDESSSIRDSTRQLATNLRSTPYTDFALAVREIEGERHSGTKSEGYNRGLRFAFATLAPNPSAALTPGYGSRSALVNLSSRARVGTGDDVLIAGFVIDGPEAKRVLVRGVGPALFYQGVPQYLTDPKLTVYNSFSAPLGTNDNWGDGADATELARISNQFGAYPLRTGSRDAALLLTLEPGAYSIVVSGVNGTQGVALAEVYEILP